MEPIAGGMTSLGCSVVGLALPPLWGLKLECLFSMVGNFQTANRGLSCHYHASKSRFKDIWDMLGMPAPRGARWARDWGNGGYKGGPSDLAGRHRD